MTRSETRIWTVSRLTARLRQTLHATFDRVSVRGELSNVSRPHSGHIYLTLKDSHSQMNGVIWRSTVERLDFEPADGDEVICGGSLEIYPPRGQYQLVIRQIQQEGVGDLRLRLQQLQRRLGAEGLFEPRRKKRLPRFPQRIAVITSPTGAAVRDFLEAIKRRRWRAEILVLPSRVQGAGAAEDLTASLQRASQLIPPPHIIVLTRGGGSLEDLWCFNEEPLVRAIAACPLPLISAVGHEIDVTLADLAADVRAMTPTEAAELVAPDGDELGRQLVRFRQRLDNSLRSLSEQARTRLEAMARHPVFRDPGQLLHVAQRRVDEMTDRLERSVRQQIAQTRHRTESLAGRLESLSPNAVLARGYSVTTDLRGRVITAVAELPIGQELQTRLADGIVMSRVTGARAVPQPSLQSQSDEP